MVRYKYIDTNARFLAVDLTKQLLPGTFEHAVHHLVEHELDLSGFDARFHKDVTGATASPPRMLLQVVLCAYAHELVSSRAIARACEEHVTFIALCGASTPHFTTIAHFVRTCGVEVARVFAGVLAVCDQQDLIGREMFAIDGVKLPSNASQRRSGTRAEFAAQATKLEAAAETMRARHRAADTAPVEPDLRAKERQHIATLEEDATQLRTWLTQHPTDRHGPGKSAGLRKSHRTDNESAKMATSKGLIQGYTGVAAVDAKHQLIVAARAYGTGSEQECLLPMVTALAPLLLADTLITADAGYHSEDTLEALADRAIEALIADGLMRTRAERFATQGRHQTAPDPLHDKTRAAPPAAALFAPSDFTYDAEARTCVCPAGQSLYRKGKQLATKGHIADRFQGAKGVCGPCPMRAQCLRTPEQTKTRQVAFFTGKTAVLADSHTARRQRRIDTPEERARYAQRFATVEPVFGNLRYHKKLDRFTLRGQPKVNGQWKLFCMVQNIEKLAHHGYAAQAA
jgi:transposase